MANVVGSLRVLLGLDAADFVQGLSRADRQAQAFAQKMRTEIGGAVKNVAGILGGLSIGREIYENTKAIIAEASALNDLSDATGSSVESLSRLNNQAKIAGTDFGTLQSALLKLSAGMAGTDEETSKAKEALKILGITTRDPAQAMQEIALKLNTYADGVNKAGLAVALFGKQGAALLPTLKDIAELQDVAATHTEEQTIQAEALGKAFRRLGVESETFKNSILNDVVPALTTLIANFNEARKSAGSFGQGLDAALSLAARDGTAVQQLRAVDAEIAKVKASLAKDFGPLKGLKEFNDAIKTETLTRLTAQRDALEAEIRRGNRTQIAKDVEAVFGPKPDAPNPPASSGGRSAARERQSDAERYIEALQRQLEGTLDLTAAEQVLRDVQTGRFKDASRAQIDVALGLAQQIDANKEAKRAADEQIASIKAFDRATEDYLESIRKAADAATRERDGILQGNEAIREQIIAITGGQVALDAYNAAKREALALEKEARANSLSPAFAAEAQALREAAAALRAMNAATADLRLAEQLKAQSDAIKQLKGEAFDIAGRAVSDLAVNGAKASDVLKNLERDLVSFLTNQALFGIKNHLVGGTGAGTDLFSILLGRGGGGSFDAGQMLTLLGQSLGFFAAGGTPSAGFAVVGENGPEIVQFSGRERVYSNAQSKAMLGGQSVTVQQNFHVNGQVDSRTARQMAREAAGAVSSVGARG